MGNKLVKAAGGIVFRDISGRLEVLLVGGSKKEPDYWGFPKGRQKDGEPIEATAVREIREETGIRVELLALAGKSEYTVLHKGKTRPKTAYYYLARVVGGNMADKDDELQHVVWIAVEQAAQTLTHDTDKGLLTRAHELVENWYRDML